MVSGVRVGRRRRPFARAGQRTNVALRWLLIAAFLTGWVAFATARGVPAVLGAGVHGLFAISLLVLAPWKYVIVRRVKRTRPMSWLLLALAVICLGSGFVQLLAGYVVIFGLSPIQVHVGSTVVGALLLIWHILRHRKQRLREIDLSRRRVLQTGAGLMGAGAGVALLTGAAHLTGGSGRRPAATGSRSVDPGRAGGARPAAIPATIWLADRVPSIDSDRHQISLPDRSLSIAELTSLARPVTARLDCTSGWYADATWTGQSLAELLGVTVQSGGLNAIGQSLIVRSVTGYTRTFPLAEANRLWLAVACQGEPLSAGNGGPVRLVAPGRRGFWWVKWVGSVELSDRPSWVQLPFPVLPLSQL